MQMLLNYTYTDVHMLIDLYTDVHMLIDLYIHRCAHAKWIIHTQCAHANWIKIPRYAHANLLIHAHMCTF